MRAVLEEVEEIVGNGEKVMIVSECMEYLTLIWEHLENIPGAVYYFYTGKTESHERDHIVECFNTTAKRMILLLSLTVGGQGLNLTAANHVMFVDIHWNPQLKLQAEDRVYRIGQTRDVFIHKFACQDTIEERIVRLQNRELEIAEDVLSRTKGRVTGLNIEELCSLFSL